MSDDMKRNGEFPHTCCGIGAGRVMHVSPCPRCDLCPACWKRYHPDRMEPGVDYPEDRMCR